MSLSKKERKTLAERLSNITKSQPEICRRLLEIEIRGISNKFDVAQLRDRLSLEAVENASAQPECCPGCYLEGRISPLLCAFEDHKQYHAALRRFQRKRQPASTPATPKAASAAPSSKPLIFDQFDRFDLIKQCTSKKRYSSTITANDVAARLFRTENIKLYSYSCVICGGFHLTSKTPKRF